MDRILIIDDEEHILELLDFNLSLEGYEVITTMSSLDGLDIIKQDKPDLVLLDWMLPKMSGIELLNIIRSDEDYDDIAVIMLTAKNMEEDKLEGLTIGADDYMTKPFNPTELTLRIKSLERRLGSDNKEEKKGERFLESGIFKVDVYGHKFYKNGLEVELTPTEHEIVKFFITNANRALSRDEILNAVWGEEFLGDSKIVDVNIRRLRSKVEEDAAHPVYIETVWGVGYRWKNAAK